MVEGYFNIRNSLILSNEQKEILLKKLFNKVNSEGFLQVRSQVYRSQLSNKEEVVRKMNILLEQALVKKNIRLATRPSKAVKEKRLEWKKKQSQHKQHRRKLKPGDY